MSHDHSGPATPAPPAVRRAVLAALLPFAVLTLVGLVVLWPSNKNTPSSDELGLPRHLVRGTVSSVRQQSCLGQLPDDGTTLDPTGGGTPNPELPDAAAPDEDARTGDASVDEQSRCAEAVLRLTDGPAKGTNISVDVPVGPTALKVERGTRLVLSYVEEAPPGLQYQIVDVQRAQPLIALGLLFALVVIAFGRRRGLAALAGLLVTFLVLARFVLPALLAGESPVAVALVGAAVIMFVALYITHGFTIRTSVAVLGTLSSLLLTGLLAVAFTAWSSVSGLASEEATFLGATQAQLNLRGLFLAGVVIGALGVLDDVTVTQTAAVWELRAANRSYGVGELYRAGVRIGRDHIASTVNTLVLAYAGAALPLLILFSVSGRGLADTLTSEIVAQEVVRALVGSIGLVASVPVTTLAAALVAVRDGDAPRRRRRWRPTDRGPDATEDWVGWRRSAD